MAGRILPAKPQSPARQPAPPAMLASTRILSTPAWHTGDGVRWQGYTGTFLRETIDGQVELLIGTRTYRAAAGELRSA